MGMGFAPTWLCEVTPPPLHHKTTLTTGCHHSPPPSSFASINTGQPRFTWKMAFKMEKEQMGQYILQTRTDSGYDIAYYCRRENGRGSLFKIRALMRTRNFGIRISLVQCWQFWIPVVLLPGQVKLRRCGRTFIDSHTIDLFTLLNCWWRFDCRYGQYELFSWFCVCS